MGKSDARRAKLDKTTVGKLLAEAERFMVWDTLIKGFGVRVAPTGTKTYFYRYRAGAGGRNAALRLLKLGQHGALTPDQAREKAKAAEAMVLLGQDPQDDLATRRAELTVSQLCAEYLEHGAKHKKASTLVLDRLRVRRHIDTHALGKRRLSEVTRADIERLSQDIAAGRIKDKTPHTRGGPGAASRTVGLLMGVFSYAGKKRYLKENPASGAERPRDIRRERYLSPDELGRLGASLAIEEAGGNRLFAAAVRLLLLTGCRKNEIVRLRWSEVNLAASRLELADSKTGARIVTLAAPAVQILAGLERTGTYVFPDPADLRQPLRNVDWSWVRTRNRADLADVRLHDLRHGFASVGAMGGLSLIMLGKLLGHKDSRSTARYAHVSADPLREAADRIASQLQSALDGQPGGEVVDFGKARA